VGSAQVKELQIIFICRCELWYTTIVSVSTHFVDRELSMYYKLALIKPTFFLCAVEFDPSGSYLGIAASDIK